jgi:N-dimethylarginine dimethylaminohydrolase
MLAQHAAYADVLRALGLELEVLDPLPGFPDAVIETSPVEAKQRVAPV